MALGTGPQALQEYIENNYQKTRAGRADLPPIIQHTVASDDPDTSTGVLVLRDRAEVRHDPGKHDLVHLYHPEANPPQYSDQGYAEKNLIEFVQVDIELTDRTDHSQSAGQQRLSAKERMTGLRGDLSSTESAPYGGILGELQYILEDTRKGLSEWDKVSMDLVNVYLGNSNADVSLMVELERIAANTV